MILLYALEPLDYTKHIELLIDFIIQGNFEVSRQSLLLIESISSHLSDVWKMIICAFLQITQISLMEAKYDLF